MLPRKTIWVGIDCGKQGGLAAIYSEGDVQVESFHAPTLVIRTKKRGKTKTGNQKYHTETKYDYLGMLRLLQRFRKLQRDHGWRVVVGIERQQPFPRDSKAVTFQVGHGMGLWEMACAATFLQAELVHISWKRNYVPAGSNKQASLAMCAKMYPASGFKLKKDEARAEATLIADFLMRRECGMAAPKKAAKGSAKKPAKAAKKTAKKGKK